MSDETELKLDVSQEGLAALDSVGLLGACTGDTNLRATYFDTPDMDLWHNGMSLRIRNDGKKSLQTVKQPAIAGGGIAQRREWETPVKARNPPVPEIQSPVAELLEKHGGPLKPVFDIAAHRRTWHLTSLGAQIEVAADDAEAITAERRHAFREIEIELISGDPAAIFALARRIDAVVPVRLGVLAKAERGFRLLAPERSAEKAEHVTLPPNISTVQAFAAIAESCLRQYRLNESIILIGATRESVHQARVALRRLRSAMVLFRQILPGEDVQRMAERIRTLAHALGDVRDLDVLVARAKPGIVHDTIEKARLNAHTRLQEALAEDEARQLMIDLAEWLALGAWRTDPDTSAAREVPLREFSAEALDRLRRKVRRHGRHLTELDEKSRHQLRKDVKKLRYGIEFLGQLFDDRKQQRQQKKFLRSLKNLLERLGALNDLSTAEIRLSALGLTGTPEADQFLGGWNKSKLLRRAADFRHNLLDERPFWR